MDGMHPISSFLPALEHLGMWGYWIVLLLGLAEAMPVAGVFVPGSSLIVLAGIAAAHGILKVGDVKAGSTAYRRGGARPYQSAEA
jgi:membrane protein DedA with SNARE-associated domain